MSAPKVDVLPLPCPFCGESPTIEPWHGGGPEKRLIHCENEDCHTSPSVTGETLGSAVSRWNQRVMPGAVAELIEALSACVADMEVTETFYGKHEQAQEVLAKAKSALARIGGAA